MSFSIYYPGCVEAVPDHICNLCGDDIEHGRISSIAFIKLSYLPTLLAGPTVAQTWIDGIATKDIVIIPQVLGSSDGGAPVEGTGYGRQQSSLLGFNFSVTYKDPNYKQNAAFYNAIKRSRNYAVAYVTESQTHISDNAVQVLPKAPIAEDLTSEVVWDVEVKFSQPDHAVPFDTPTGVFDACFDYEP
jgi:hypothetical protein